MLRFDSCPNCFLALNGCTKCANCGFDYGNSRKYSGVLEPFTILNNKYILGRVLGRGGFGVTYIALDVSKNKVCAIKEYMPADYSKRQDGIKNIIPFSDNKSKYVFEHGRQKFVEEARTLYKLKRDPIVVDIWDYFTENNTAYLVMEFLDGADLRRTAKMNGGRVDPNFAKDVFLTVASSLMEIHHKNILHRDLSPENIFITNNNEIKLIDFGSARNYVSQQNKGMSILLKPGFAPPEQYSTTGNQGPWSDVYSLCATFYNVVSGKPLVDALYLYRGEKMKSLYELGCPVTKRTSDVIEKGMAPDYNNRYKNFDELLNDIDICVNPAGRSTNGKAPNNMSSPSGGKVTNNMGNATGGKVTNNMGNATGGKVLNNTAKESYAPYVGIMKGNKLNGKIPIEPNIDYTIGRSVKNSRIVIGGDSNISRVHCAVKFDEASGNFIVTDCSSNGTFFINNERLAKNMSYRIKPGSKLYLASQNNTIMFFIDKKSTNAI